jgi:hypothetical protein
VLFICTLFFYLLSLIIFTSRANLLIWESAWKSIEQQLAYLISKVFKPFSLCKLQCGCLFVLVTILGLLILLSGNVEINPGPSNNLFLNIGHINARSLRSEDKFEEIVSLVLDLKLDIFAVSETWLNDSISADSLQIPSFSPMFHLDRSNSRRAGGVALYISSSLVAKRRLDLEKVGIELLWVEI